VPSPARRDPDRCSGEFDGAQSHMELYPTETVDPDSRRRGRRLGRRHRPPRRYRSLPPRPPATSPSPGWGGHHQSGTAETLKTGGPTSCGVLFNGLRSRLGALYGVTVKVDSIHTEMFRTIEPSGEGGPARKGRQVPTLSWDRKAKNQGEVPRTRHGRSRLERNAARHRPPQERSRGDDSPRCR